MKKFAVSGPVRALAAALALATLSGVLSGCAAPVVVGAAIGSGVLMAADRRTSGAQVEDEGIELKAAGRIHDTLGTRVRVSVTSYNRQVLLTGEVPNEADHQRVQQLVAGLDNVRSVVNELGIVNSPTLTERASDTLITGRVKAGFVDSSELSANAFKVVTERGTVYLMGRVTRREADLATAVVRNISGVKGVVRIFEYISEEELRRLQAQPSKV
ncbi:MAG: hypothetical protein RJA36_351 [Pseudomonadota bacterium]|jgi:osmotically-inducible protein OsmY